MLHLVTAAEGAVYAYRRYPENRRGEYPEEAVRLDHLLQWVWGGHPRYMLIDDNAGREWAAKSQAAREVLEMWWKDSRL